MLGGRRDYYVYDGDELTLTLSHGADGGWRVAQRIVSAGIDGALAGRYWTPEAGSPQSLFVLRDRQGTTLGAYRADGTPDPQSWYQPLGAFGAPAGDGSSTSGGKSSATATGFTGAGAPSASGGYVYLRNRWYDPATGRFLTQDPIGLAGGVNLYAYAGNDPVNFSDPFGLCEKEDEVCHKLVTDLRAQDGKVFHNAADRYDAIEKGRVRIVGANDRMLDPHGLNGDGNPDTFVLGVTYGSGANANVYLRKDQSEGDRLLTAEHESRHLAGESHYRGGPDPMAYGDWTAYNQLSPALRATAREASDEFFHWWGPKYGKHNPAPETKR